MNRPGYFFGIVRLTRHLKNHISLFKILQKKNCYYFLKLIFNTKIIVNIKPTHNRTFRYLPYLSILLLLLFSGCFTSYGKRDKVDVLEQKINELARKLENVESYSKNIDYKVDQVSKQKEEISTEFRKLHNDIQTLNSKNQEIEVGTSKMRKAVISTQKAIRKIYDKILNVEENQSGLQKQVDDIQVNPFVKNGETFDEVGFKQSGGKQIVLDYVGTKRSNAENKLDEELKFKLNEAKTLEYKGDTKKAIALYEDLLRANPNYPDIYFALGNLYYDNGHIKKSIKIYETLVLLVPNDAESHSLLGVAYAKNDMLGNAIVELKKALNINPNLTEVRVGLSVVYIKNGEWDKAIDENLSAIKINPDFAKAHKYLGIAYKKKGMKRKSKQAFKKYKEISNRQ